MGATRRFLAIVARLFFGLLTLAAIITQLTIHVQNGFNLVNFFSYFTNLSNILAAIVFILVVYVVYTLIRGSIVGFYPYPFLNPGKVSGYSIVALYCLGILVVFLLLSWLLMVLGNNLKRTIA